MEKRKRAIASPPTSEPKGSQVTRVAPDIEYADEDSAPLPDPRASPPPPTARTVEGAKANAAAAREAIARHNAGVPFRPVVLPTSAPVSEEHSKANAPRVFRVVGDYILAKGAAKYVLKSGKLVTDRGYDIEGLRAQGVQLEELERPTPKL